MQDELTGNDWVEEAVRKLDETIEPILTAVKSNSATVNSMPGPALQLAIESDRGRGQLDFLVRVTDRKIGVSCTVNDSMEEDLGLHLLSEVTESLVENYVNEFLSSVNPD